jgi:hypothetical protein
MDFVHPALLAGAALAVIPIVLHLVLRQKPKHIHFPALRFLKQRQHSNSRRLKLRHLLLLALRIAAIVLVALALARPSIQLSGLGADQEAPVAAALIFDTSPRMNYRNHNQTRLAAAQELAHWLLAELPAESQIAIVDAASPTALFQIDLAAAQARVDRLQPGYTAATLLPALDEARQLLAGSQLERREIYVFTDLAQTAWAEDSASAERIAALKPMGCYLIDVGVSDPKNTSLGRVQLSSQSVAQSTPVTIATDVSQMGTSVDSTLQLWISQLGQPPQKRSEVALSLGIDESRAVDFPALTLEEGTHQGLVRWAGDDALPDDNVRYFTIEVTTPWKVLLASTPPVAEQTLFLHEALSPTEFRKTGQARFHCDLVSLESLSGQSLNEYSALFLLDPPPLPIENWRKLTDYAANGGGVAFFLGPQAQPVDSFNSAAALELLAGKLVAQVRRPDGNCHLVIDRYEHPALAKFAPLSGSVPWDALPVFRYWQLDELAGDVLTLARFSDGGGALFDRPVGAGRVVTCTTPISQPASANAWNLLPTGLDAWPFVMLSNELALYLVGASSSQWNYQLGQTVSLRPRTDVALANYVLTTPSGEQIRKSVEPGQLSLVVTGAEQPGNYQLRAGGEQQTLQSGFSLNLAPEATDLLRLTEAQLATLEEQYGFHLARTKEEISRDVGLTRVGRELYPYLILLVALVMAAEYLLANRFYRSE